LTHPFTWLFEAGDKEHIAIKGDAAILVVSSALTIPTPKTSSNAKNKFFI
jgi:hypothetical protein